MAFDLSDEELKATRIMNKVASKEELYERIAELEEIEKEHKKENGELREEVKNSISTLKIKEIIEELKKEADYRTIDNPTGRIHFYKEPCDYQIEILQELLEEGDDK